jgi:CRISPR/Cas system CMR subunit Cmr4 (Cas7 group RAMP superfamily)
MENKTDITDLKVIESGVEAELKPVQLPEGLGIIHTTTNEVIAKLKDDYERLEYYKNQYKNIVKKTDEALKKAEQIISDRKTAIENKLLDFYTSEIEITKKVGDIEVNVKELPSIKYDYVKIVERVQFEYDDDLLMKNPAFARVKPTLNKLAVRAEYKKSGKVDGLKVEKVKTVKVSF